jgi:hypothetical protein
MKTELLIAALTTLSFAAYCQDNVELDNLKSSTSTAMNLLGIANSDIEKPTDCSQLVSTIRSSTQGFTALPNQFGVEVAPFLLSPKLYKHNTLNYTDSVQFKEVFKQTLQLSVGIDKGTIDGKGNYTKVGLGIRFSIIRPQWSNDSRTEYGKIMQYKKKRMDAITAMRDALYDEGIDSVFTALLVALDKEKKRAIVDTIKVNELNAEINAIVNIEEEKIRKKYPIKTIDLNFTRTGLFMDFAAGTVLDFPTNNWQQSRLPKSGAWLNFGYNNKTNTVYYVGIIRYLYNPDKSLLYDSLVAASLQQVHSLDLGGRLIINESKDKYLFSAEAVYRSFAGTNLGTWRFMANAEYAISTNQRLTFSFGKNYDGAFTKDGNILAALSFIKGIGNAKKS